MVRRIIFLFAYLLALCLLGHSQAVTQCDKTFFNDYNGNGILANPYSMVELNDSSLLFAGIGYPDIPAAITRTGFMSVVSKSGVVKTAKNIYYKNDGGILYLKKLTDGGLLTGGNASNSTDYGTVFSRYDNQMNLQWEKIIQPAGFFNIATDGADNIYVGSLVGQMFIDQRLVITKLTTAGAVSYRYAFNYSDPGMVYGNYGCLCIFNNKLYVSFQVNKLFQWYTLLLCIDPATGNLQWSHLMTSPDAVELNATDQLFVNNTHLYMGNYSNLQTSFKGYTLLELDANGNTLQTKRFSLPNQMLGMIFSPAPDGNFVATGFGYNYVLPSPPPLRSYLRIDAALNVINSKQNISPFPHGPVGFFQSADGYVYEGGRNGAAASGSDFYLRKMNPLGNSGTCTADTCPLVIGSIQVTYTNLPVTRAAESATYPALNRIEDPSSVTTETKYCTNDCDTIYLSLESSDCNTGIYAVKAHKSKSCTTSTQWNTNPALITITDQTDSTVQFRFGRPGQTKIYVTLFNGCRLLQDSLLVKSSGSPAILGNDTSFCAGDSLVIKPNKTFGTYQWNTGAQGSSITIHAAGQYWLHATDANGCILRDTINIPSLYLAPVSTLEHNPVLCSGSFKTLSPGAGFTTYQWNDGSAAATLQVAAIGKYWVVITETHGCKTSDTAVILSTKSPPVNYLPADTTICGYQDIILQPDTVFSSYAWSTGTQSHSITVNNAGIYSLSVIDAAGCKGTDSIVITSKACANSIYFPNVFSPNQDGNNDVYRPKVTGQLSYYLLRIYNRFGQMAFSTGNYLTAWDGTISGKLQNNGGYTFICSWQFENGAREFKKGVLLLTR